jgi:hypothetical protein
MRRVLCIGGIAAFLALVLVTPSADAAATPPPRVAAFGDSLLAEAGPSLQRFAALTGVQVEVAAIGGSALCDWVEPIQTAVADPSIAVVVVAFTGNNLTPCASDSNGRGQEGTALADIYADATARVMERARPSTQVLWVTAPANRDPNPNGDAVRDAVVATAGHYRNTSIVDGGWGITPGGRWSATQPCLFLEPCTGPVVAGVRHDVVRAPDGAHFCPSGPAADGSPCPVHSSGALRYALNVLSAVLRVPEP